MTWYNIDWRIFELNSYSDGKFDARIYPYSPKKAPPKPARAADPYVALGLALEAYFKREQSHPELPNNAALFQKNKQVLVIRLDYTCVELRPDGEQWQACMCDGSPERTPRQIFRDRSIHRALGLAVNGYVALYYKPFVIEQARTGDHPLPKESLPLELMYVIKRHQVRRSNVNSRIFQFFIRRAAQLFSGTKS